MEILLVTTRFPYPTRTGDTLTIFHLLRHLSHRHSIDLVACTKGAVARDCMEAVSPFCRSIHTVPLSPLRHAVNGAAAIIRGEPLQLGWFYTARMAHEVERLVERNQYDVLYGHTIRAARYLTRLTTSPSALRVLAMQISMQLNYRRLAACERNPVYRAVFKREADRLASFESQLVRQFDRALVISDVDRRSICEDQNERFFECPHGVTLDDDPADPDDREPGSIMFSGNMNYRPNVDAATYFVRQILPDIRARFPDVTFFIVGANPHSSVRALAKDPSVTVTGEVDSIYSWLRRASVGVNPLRAGAGLQNKVLEGMACGLPLVVTPVANEGIMAVPGVHLLTAAGPSEFADAVVRLLERGDLRRKLGSAARNFIEENWSWDKHFDRLERMFEEHARVRRSGDRP